MTGAHALALASTVAAAGCGVLGPTCLDSQARMTFLQEAGGVDAGGVAVHVVAYDERGSQNDVEVQWTGDSLADGPRLEFYATRESCESGPDERANPGAPCAVLARGGRRADGAVARTLVVTHGRGNPEVLGVPPRFKVWIVGDPAERVHYTFTVSWFYGADC
ncbi:MAG: hypothetical protein AB7O67_16385 [Vicinamibacterales bacterium]